MSIIPITFNLEVQKLLSNKGLPFEDLSTSQHVTLFAMQNNNGLVGTVVVEHYEKEVLIRSLAVHCDYRNEGYGKDLLAFAESWSAKNGIESLYLLTTTAEKYFTQYGYQEIDRNQASTAITKTTQFSTLYPSSAILMVQRLS